MFAALRYHLTPALLAMSLLWPGAATRAQENLIFSFPKVGYPPYLMPEGTGERGIMTHVLEEISEQLGYRLVLDYLPDSRATALQLIGKIDATANAREWVEDPDRFLWSDPIISVADNLVFRKEAAVPVTSPQDIAGHRVGTMLNYQYPSFEEAFANGQLIRQNTRSFASLLKMVLLKRTDTALLDRNVALWTLRTRPELNGEDFHLSENGFDSVGYRIRFSKTSRMHEFQPAFNKALANLISSGGLEKIMANYR